MRIWAVTPAEPGGRTRVAILSAIGGRLSAGYFGVLTEGFPQLVRVNPDVLGLETEQPLPTNFPALCRARMIHEYPLVPDLERLEQNLFRGESRDIGSPQVFGGQVLGQALMAASRTVEPARAAHALVHVLDHRLAVDIRERLAR